MLLTKESPTQRLSLPASCGNNPSLPSSPESTYLFHLHTLEKQFIKLVTLKYTRVTAVLKPKPNPKKKQYTIKPLYCFGKEKSFLSSQNATFPIVVITRVITFQLPGSKACTGTRCDPTTATFACSLTSVGKKFGRVGCGRKAQEGTTLSVIRTEVHDSTTAMMPPEVASAGKTWTHSPFSLSTQ